MVHRVDRRPNRRRIGAMAVGPVLAALADSTRRELLQLLVHKGRASATTLANPLPVSRQAVVKHLQILSESGLVSGTREGREVLFEVQPDRLASTADWLSALADTWDRRLDSIKRAAESGGQ